MVMMNNNTTQLELRPSPPNTRPEIFPNFESHSPHGGVNFPLQKYHQNSRKKRTKLIRINDNVGVSSSGFSKPKYTKKPDPSAPNITRPCSECGKKFWSWKALFGHMRCHPERQWRGINPPPNFRQPNNANDHLDAQMSEEDHEIASCLLMLANGPSAYNNESTPPTTVNSASTANQGLLEWDNVVRDVLIQGGGGHGAARSYVDFRFECSSCKKVFGSHQALGGHRASHKNVKGCFAVTRSDIGEEDDDDRIGCDGDDRINGEVKENGEDKMVMALRHQCSICFRGFSSGQALGGHKRCHWEKVDEPLLGGLSQGLNLFSRKEGCSLDLNLPAPVEDDSSSSLSYSSGLITLDLRLGI